VRAVLAIKRGEQSRDILQRGQMGPVDTRTRPDSGRPIASDAFALAFDINSVGEGLVDYQAGIFFSVFDSRERKENRGGISSAARFIIKSSSRETGPRNFISAFIAPPRANQSVNLNKYNLCKPECPPICRDIN